MHTANSVQYLYTPLLPKTTVLETSWSQRTAILLPSQTGSSFYDVELQSPVESHPVVDSQTQLAKAVFTLLTIRHNCGVLRRNRFN